MRVSGRGEGRGQAHRTEAVLAADRVQLDENATFELIGRCKATRGLAGGGRAHRAHAKERKRAESHKS